MKPGYREDFAGFVLEKSACGWWVIDPDSPERGDGGWLFSTKTAAMNFVLHNLGGM